MPERRNFYDGSISYERLWETMRKRGLKKQDLKGSQHWSINLPKMKMWQWIQSCTYVTN